MNPRTRFKAAAALVAGVGIAAMYVLLWSGPTDQDRPALSKSTLPVVSTELEAESVRSVVAGNEVRDGGHKRTIRDYLEDYYGDEWPAKSGEFEKRQKALLDRPLDEAEQIRPWEEVADQIRTEVVWDVAGIEQRAEAALEWDPNLDLSWETIAKVFPNVPPNMGERQLLEFQGLVRELNAPIRELALQQNAALADALVCKWTANDLVHAPYSIPWITADPRRTWVLTSSTSSKTAWCVSMFVYADEVPPGFEANQRMVQQMVEARSGSLSKYLNSFR